MSYPFGFLLCFSFLELCRTIQIVKIFRDDYIYESDPSSPSCHNGRQSSSTSSPREGRTRLLTDLPVTLDMAKELRSKFLNDCSTPEQESLTS